MCFLGYPTSPDTLSFFTCINFAPAVTEWAGVHVIMLTEVSMLHGQLLFSFLLQVLLAAICYSVSIERP